MSDFLGTIGTFFDWGVRQLGLCLTTITASAPLTVLVLAMPICAWCVHLLRLFIRAN